MTQNNIALFACDIQEWVFNRLKLKRLDTLKSYSLKISPSSYVLHMENEGEIEIGIVVWNCSLELIMKMEL